MAFDERDRDQGSGLLRQDIELTVICDRCHAEVVIVLPLLSDWRDRQRIEHVRSIFPSTPCTACGEAVPTPGPVVVLRPGDPIAVLFCATDADLGSTRRLSDVLATQANRAGVIPGPVANTSPELIGRVADRYSGFQLVGIDAPGQEWATDPGAHEWLESMRTHHPWPNVVGALNAFLVAEEADTELALAANATLREPSWEPVIRHLGAVTAAAQRDADAASAVKARVARIAQATLRDSGFDANSAVARTALGLLEKLTRLAASPKRSTDDLRTAIDTGISLVALATEQYGRDHPLTLTAMNDTAALMLDDLANAGTSVVDARDLLREVRLTAIRDNLPIVVDATVNLAIANLRGDRIADADVAERAISLLRDGIHLCQLYFPDEPHRALSAIVNHAALTRSRLTGDANLNVALALELFDTARSLEREDRRLAIADRIMLEGNVASAIGDRARLNPSQANDQAVSEAVQRLAPQLDQLELTHPVRSRVLTNLGAMVLEMLHRTTSTVDPRLVEQAEAWLEDAVTSTGHLAPDDAARILATTTLAGLLFWRGSETDLNRAHELLTQCATALSESTATRLHHVVFQNLAQLHLVRGDWDSAVDVLATACEYADEVIERAVTPATRLGHVAAAGDLFQRLALLYAHHQDARSVVHVIERSRARWRSGAVGQYEPTKVDLAVQARLRDGAALLYVGICSLGSYAVVLVGGGGAGAWTALAKSSDVLPVLAALQNADDIEGVRDALDHAARVLGHGLLDQASHILRSAHVGEIGVVASGALAGLPVVSLDAPAATLDLDATVQYLVGVQVASNRPALDASVVVAIADPTGDLRFARDEVEAIERYAPNVVVPPPEVGVRGWLLDILPTATHLHLACHARYDPTDPFASQVILGETAALTVADIASVSTPNLSIVVASCCRTGVVDQKGADEMVGLAHAMIAAGAASALAALWDIDDASTTLLMARFYDRLSKGDQPPVALAEAQRTLRDTTMEEFLELANPPSGESWIPLALRRELRVLALHPEHRAGSTRPFKHPANWAGVVYIAN